jgi:putative ABC transport system substrate-binding protein
MICRREFVTLLGGAAAAWPVGARAQQGARMRRVGVLMNLAAEDPISVARAKAFDQGLQALGWIDGRNVRLDYRWAEGKADLFQRYASELVGLAPDVILTSGGAGVPPVMQATRTIPIVFVIVPDPVGNGFVASLSRPGGNATGFSMFEYNLTAKWVELLKGNRSEGYSRGSFARRCCSRDWTVRRHTVRRTDVGCGRNAD